MRMQLTPIADAIARVFWFWRNQPNSPMLRENPLSRLHLALSDAKSLPAGATIATPEEITRGTYCDKPLSAAALSGPFYTDGERIGTAADFKEPAYDLDSPEGSDGTIVIKPCGPSIRELIDSGELRQATSGDYDPEKLREKIISRGREKFATGKDGKLVATAAQRDAILRGELEVPEGGVRVGPIPKRIRSRHKPLTVADIVEGGVYVPKRGNDKTPNYRVTDIEPVPLELDPDVYFEREGVENSDGWCDLSAFLKLVARRANA